MRLSFANEATRLVEYSNANLQDVLKGVGLDTRIGLHYFRPSPSWGGSCFPKDLIEVNNFCKTGKPIFINVYTQRIVRCHSHVNAQIKLKSINRQRIRHVL